MTKKQELAIKTLRREALKGGRAVSAERVNDLFGDSRCISYFLEVEGRGNMRSIAAHVFIGPRGGLTVFRPNATKPVHCNGFYDAASKWDL